MSDPSRELLQFQNRLAQLGADLERWPLAERAAAARLLLTSDEARAAREHAAGLDAQLLSAGRLPASEALRSRVLAIPDQHPQLAERGLGRQAPRWAVALLAAAALLGVMTERLIAPPEPPAAMQEDVDSVADPLDPLALGTEELL